jgi:hypothetical protein
VRSRSAARRSSRWSSASATRSARASLNGSFWFSRTATSSAGW